VSAAGDLPPVTADGEAVAQALENLLSNAMKYSPNDRRIDVQVGREKGMASVKVIDHGVGVPRPLQRKIFRKFYRVETDNFGPQGSGLGLAIVYGIMRAHQATCASTNRVRQHVHLCFRIEEQPAAAARGGRSGAAGD
jgi:signal transduction histidine kinase